MAYSILIIEDEQEIADSLQYALSTEGMKPVWVSNGEDATQTLQQDKIDLCILDVGLPDCSGFDLLKQIRKISDIPVIMLTARSEEIDRIVGLELGADDYVSKPFSPRELVVRVKAVLRRTGSNEPTVQGITIDPQTKRVTYNGIVLDLTRSEYVLLETLLAQPKRIFSRRQLIESVWSSQHPSDDRVIDTHVKTLRAKLKDVDNHSQLIITHRGFGYSLEA